MKLLKWLKLDYTDNGEDAKTECLWCSSSNMEISTEPPHQFQCWSCKKTGNGYTLLKQYYESHSDITPRDFRELSELKKGLKFKAVKQAGLKTCLGGYLFPVRNSEGTLTCLYRYSVDSNICYSTPKPFSLTLLGVDTLKKERAIYLPEGHWDYLALKSHAPDLNVLGVCGSTFPAKHLSLLENRKVIWLGDNDEAGSEGCHRLACAMKQAGQQATSLRYLDWSKIKFLDGSSPPEKFDVRDLINKLNS